MVEHSSANPKVPVRFQAWSHTRVTDYDEACKMHLTPEVVHNFPKAVGVTGNVVESVIGVFAYILTRLEGSHVCVVVLSNMDGSLRLFKIRAVYVD